jgi:glycosyltransferase involved in cell wall biosynthesis
VIVCAPDEMRILHLLATPVFSGPAENLAQLALAQRALGHEVSVAVDRKRSGLGSEEPAVPRFEALGLLDVSGLEMSIKSTPLGVLRDIQSIKRRSVDVVHCHFTHDHVLTRLGRPVGARMIRSIHAPRSLRFSTPYADAWTVPTEAELKKLGGAPAVVLPALISAEFRPNDDRGTLQRSLRLSGAPVIGMVSTFQASRRHELGLAAFAELRRQQPEAHLVLVGDGILQPRIASLVERAGLSSAVTFAGYQRGADFVRWLQALDEVWILGLGNDFSARAAAQARACGARVVAVAEGALPSLADALVEPNVESVARAALGASRLNAAVASPEDIAREVLALYSSIGKRAA